jgi:membrane protease YdiL (CAAX protease family)
MDPGGKTVERESMISEPAAANDPTFRTEALLVTTYFAIYLVYLSYSLENEFLHWLSLVIIPFGLLFLYQGIRTSAWSVRASLSTVGLEKQRAKNGMVWAVLIGLALSGLQLFLSRNKDQILEVLMSRKVFVLFPASLLLMLFLAGFTEEFFFRGVLQTRLQRLFRSNLAAVLVTSFLFGLYHLQYAYLNPRWPSHGNWPDALGAAFGQGVPMGLILGALYVRTKNNLVACVLVHALINSFPGMLMIKMGGG